MRSVTSRMRVPSWKNMYGMFETSEDKQWRKFFPRLEISAEEAEGATEDVEEERPGGRTERTPETADIG